MGHDPENNAVPNDPNFGLPDGYFQKSALSILNKAEWLDEHRDFKMLSALRDKRCFSVPGTYFAGAGHKLELVPYPLLSGLPKQQVFIVPENYFSEAETLELSRIMTDEEPVLNFITKQQTFTVGENYFSDKSIALEKLLSTDKKPARLISLFSKRTFAAVAAIFIVVIGTWLYNGYLLPGDVKDCGTIACIDKAELLKSAHLENLETDELYELVNTSQLEQKLEKDTKKEEKNKTPDSLDSDRDEYLRDEI